MNYKKCLVNRIEELRVQKEFSWEKLFYSAGLSKGTLTPFKAAKSDIKFSTLLKLSAALDVTPSELLNFDIDLSELE